MRESVAAILRWKEEIFFIRRSEELEAFPGYYSFPGGSLQKGESRRDALAREIGEELHFDLKSSGIVLSVEEYAWAKTPDFVPYRFKTTFYLVDIKEKIPFPHTSTEIDVGHWVCPREALGDFSRGLLLAVAPTVALLEALAQGERGGPLNLGLRCDGQREIPVIECVGGVVQLLVLSNTLPPAERTNAFLIGDEGEKRILIDPSPRDDGEYRRLLNTMEGHPVDEIFLTHHHGDHHQFSPALAKHWRVPVSMSKYTRDMIVKRWGADYFKDVEVETLGHNSVLTKSRGSPVVAVSVPGHDRGQLAPMVESRAWMIVGDLIQTVGTVVIGGEEGDMAQYFSSLQRAIDLNPRVIFPSHGMPLGGVSRIRKTLAHRKAREKQIKTLLAQGCTEDEMFRCIYRELDPHLEQYARATIRSHLKKIASD